ncbi:MAG: VWA domain-containing protein [Acidobacteriota bacterium]
MRRVWLATIALALAASSMAGTDSNPSLRITSPAADAVISGTTRLEAVIAPEEAATRVEGVNFYVDGRLVCTIAVPPFACRWDAGSILRGHHVRVVASFRDGARLVGNVRTKDLGYAEHVQSDAVLVPVVVKQNNQFVRGLKARDFEVSEDGVAQSIANLAAEEAPLDLVVAIDISGSMEQALPEVRAAVKRLLSRLRPGDAVTLLGFNDTSFVVAERETDPKTREDAVDLLSAWGGTALYDATIRALDLVGTQWGRKGVVVFSDGDDRNSLTRREAAMARVQASDAVLYTVGFGSGATVQNLRQNLETYATTTGGRSYFPRDARELDTAFDAIVTELANQYVLSYAPRNAEHDDRWRSIKVRVRSGKYSIRARAGYRLDGSQLAKGKQ